MTLSTQGQPTVTVTAKAVETILGLMAERELDGHYLRLFVDGIGCTGFQYGMAFADELQDGDTVIESHGLGVLVDPNSLALLNGATVDCVDTPEGVDFKIDNPNEAPGLACSSCGGGCS